MNLIEWTHSLEIGVNFTSTRRSDKAISLSVCENECSATVQCVAYTFSGIDGCQLKLGALTKRLFDGAATTYVRVNVPVPDGDPRTYLQFSNAIYPAGIFLSINGTSVSCAHHCNNEGSCIGYYYETGLCRLVKSLGNMRVVPGQIFYLDATQVSLTRPSKVYKDYPGFLLS